MPLIPLAQLSRPARSWPRFLPLALLLLPFLLLAGCSDNDPNLSYSYVRSVGEFKVDTASVDALCDDPGPYFKSNGVDPKATCRGIQKLKLTWERPDDIEDFRGYMLYLDTTPRDRKDWKRVQNEDGEAALAILDDGKVMEQVIFLYDRKNPPEGIEARMAPDTVKNGQRRIIGIDTAGRLEDSTSRFIFAMATRYGGGKTPGQPQYSWIITGDKDPPRPFAPRIHGGDRRLELAWARPNDPTSFFNPLLDTGLIMEYRLTVKLSGADIKARSERFRPVLEYYRGGVRLEEGVKDSVLKNAGEAYGREWSLPDQNRARRGEPGKEDSLQVVVAGLEPSMPYDVQIYAVDSAGNTNIKTMSTFFTVRLTDTTRPSTPDLEIIDSLTKPNTFTVRWVASRDSTDVDGDGNLEPGPTPNYHIESYRLIRTLIPRTAADSGHLDRRDTVIQVKDVGDTVTVFHLTERFLPPGKEYLLRLTAMDTSRYVSLEDTLRIATRPIRFSGADSSLACPPGFIPIPRARFTLGDLNAASQKRPNEQGKAVTMAAYCIEPYEHRDSAGKFVTKVTWKEAQAACEAISKDHETALCTEAEWERACEGFDISNPHLHGIQRELDPSILQTRCNQGSGDVAMAMSLELRNPVCLTNEGVHDMTGNLSEWVRDVYFDSAYRYMGDTLGHDDVAKAPLGRPNGVRGGNFLAPTKLTSQATLLAHARCNNRDFAMQVRPVFRKDCVDSVPRIAIQYPGSGLGSHRCISIPDSLRGRPLTDVIPTQGDTTGTRLTLFEAGTTQAHQVVIPPDTAFRGRKPQKAQITTLSVAEVIFDRVGTANDSVKDTLETSEMRDTSQATLEYILKRESPSASWQPRKVDGRYYIRRLYAYATLGSKDGREHYASPTLGFRCCARPLPSASQVPAGP